MKLKEVTKGEVYYITTDEEGYNNYTRHSEGYWTRTMGESEESYYGTEELEELFQQHVNGPKVDKLLTCKLMVAPIGSERFEPIRVLPTGSEHHGKPYPFLSFTEAAEWASENLSRGCRWYVETNKD